MKDSRIYVCERCIEDPDLQLVVREHRISKECDYCGRKAKKPIACELSDVIERIRFAVNQHYTDPRNFVMWNSREGGWQGHPVHDGRDLFDNIGWYVQNEDLMEDIVGAFFDEEFADEDFWPGPHHERQMSSWERFKYVVKHQRRYTFWNVDNDPTLGIAEFQPQEILSSICDAIRLVGLATTLPSKQRFWRFRVHGSSETLNQPSDFSSPPLEKANFPNRMSPSGIPMFYGADDFDTGLAETVDPDQTKRTKATGAAFENLVPLNILDLTAIPESIGFFSDQTKDVREAISFLRQFTHDISQPIKKDGSQHTEYVPTQVFTEYIRYDMTTPDGNSFYGIKYPSSKNGKGCYVLFLSQGECLPVDDEFPEPQVVRFVNRSLKTVSVSRKRKPK